MNSALRSDKPIEGHVKGQIANVEKALAKAPSPPPPELVWRGASNKGAQEFVAGLSAGDVITMKGFQSTSINPTFAHGWGGGQVLFEIKPAKGAYVRPISHHSGEYEYLLPHGAKYTVRGMAKIKLGGSASPVNVVQLEMHP